MKTKFLALLTVMAAAALFTGCVATADGHTKAAVPFRKDKIVSRYEFPVDKIFAAAKQVLLTDGVLEAENLINNSLKAKLNTRVVWVRVDKVNDQLSQVTVQVRTRAGGTDIDLAAQIDKDIALHLR